jgi:hypothetical protein
MENMPGMTMTTTGAALAANSLRASSTGLNIALSQTSSGAALASTAGAQPMPSAHVAAGLAGVLGVMAYGLI